MTSKGFTSLDICEFIYSSVLRGYNAGDDKQGPTLIKEDAPRENVETINFTSPHLPSSPSSSIGGHRRQYPPSSLNTESISDLGSMVEDSPILRQSVFATDENKGNTPDTTLSKTRNKSRKLFPDSECDKPLSADFCLTSEIEETHTQTLRGERKENQVPAMTAVELQPATSSPATSSRRIINLNARKALLTRPSFSITSTTRSEPPNCNQQPPPEKEASSPADYDSNLPQESSSPCYQSVKGSRFLFSESDSDFLVTESSNRLSVDDSSLLFGHSLGNSEQLTSENHNLTDSASLLPPSTPQRKLCTQEKGSEALSPLSNGAAALTPRAPADETQSLDNASHALANTSLSEAGESVPNEVSPSEPYQNDHDGVATRWGRKERALTFHEEEPNKPFPTENRRHSLSNRSSTHTKPKVPLRAMDKKSKSLAPGFKMSGFLRSPSSITVTKSFDVQQHHVKPKRELFPADESDDTPLRPQIKLVDVATSIVAQKASGSDDGTTRVKEEFVRSKTLDEQKFKEPATIPPPPANNEVIELEDGTSYTLYPHQVQGIAWIHSNFKKRTGCILADDMGLGKTVQTAFFLRNLFAKKEIRWALILCPKSVTSTWEDHLYKICQKVPYHLFYGHNRLRRLEKFRQSSSEGIVITTYDTFRSSANDLLACDPQGTEWDVWVADEATQMKNPSARVRKSAEGLVCHFALFLTGTPIMNNYDELWSLMDLAQPGILGCHADFKARFAILLDKKRWGTEARRDALATELRDRVCPYILRRTKEDIFSPPPSSDEAQGGSPAAEDLSFLSGPPRPLTLPSKTDIIVWQDLSRLQHTIYQAAKTRIDYKDRSRLLFNISYLKKLCRHPVLCLPVGRQQWRMYERIEPKGLLRDEDEEELMGNEVYHYPEELTDEWSIIEAEIDQASAEDLRACCPKLTALHSLLPALLASDHSVLIFSESTSILDLIEKVVLGPLGLQDVTRRIDGSVELKARARIMDDFNEDPRVRLMLLSTGAAALGLTLVKADRVVMMDPSWNPAKDAQAIDRAHRIGQQRSVMIFRFVMGGAIEDNMLRLQLLKLNLSSKILSGAAYKTWFTQEDLRDLFQLADCETSKTRSVMRSLTENEAKLEADLGASLGGDPREILKCHGFAWMDDVVKDLEEDKHRRKVKRQQRCLL